VGHRAPQPIAAISDHRGGWPCVDSDPLCGARST
jgi:hypothetical protein